MPDASYDTHFDAVIVGSGFGGSVSAYRLAEAGLRVCLLERGRAYPPGTFARTPAGLAKNFWDPSEKLYGMFDVWSFRGIESLVSSGLGGGSLIYANVLLRKDEHWFVDDDRPGLPHRKWPVDRAALDEHYDRVERMMNALPYPFAEAPYRDTPKTKAMLDAAKAMGRANDWVLPRLAVTWGRPGETPSPGQLIDDGSGNLHGRARVSCQLCGECDVGCNYGAKNTLDYNYLSRAKDEGADIRTLCEVKTFAPRAGGGYAVRYVAHDADRGTPPLPHEITCDRLILAAGTFGSTYLLLKNRGALPNLSDALGSRFCGNGDLLTFAFDCTDECDGGRTARPMEPTYGPVITSALRVGDTLDGLGDVGRGFYVEDAGVPSFVSWLLEETDASQAAERGLRFAWHQVRRALHVGGKTDLSAELSALLGPGDRSSCTVPLLGMGRDVPNGRMWLDDAGWLENDWTTDASAAYFERMRDVMRQMADAWGARHFQDNPLWYLKRVITVHPLGGCPMGTSRDEGVVDPYGEVFGHDGLYVADGSVLPGPVGANPSLTIAALADRFADRIVDRVGRRRAAAVQAPAGAVVASAEARSAC